MVPKMAAVYGHAGVACGLSLPGILANGKSLLLWGCGNSGRPRAQATPLANMSPQTPLVLHLERVITAGPVQGRVVSTCEAVLFCLPGPS